MSTKYPGGFITKSPVAPTTTAASGVWTLDQQQQYQKAGTWPSPPIFIEDLFSTYLYTGNGSTQTITNGIDLSTKGGLVWVKMRSNGSATGNVLFDTARGASQKLETNTTGASSNWTPYGVSAFGSTGFTVADDGAGNYITNNSGVNYASWTFREQPKFFDVVTYTGNGTSGRAIPHSLGSTPGCIIVKCTTNTYDWMVYHRSLPSSSYFLKLNTTAAQANVSSIWSTTAPTATDFYVGSDGSTNGSGETYVAYIFAHDAGGFPASGGGSTNGISCGSFTTDPSTGGATVNLGYEPQWLLVKSATSVQGWHLIDNMRGMANLGTYGDAAFVEPNTSSAESTGANCYPTANGFWYARSGNTTYIYIAIRRGPMKVPTSGTSVFNPAAETPSGSANYVMNSSSGFPVDMLLYKERNNVATPYLTNRLTNNYLETASTAAEASYTYGYDLMQGVRGQFNATSQVDYAFRRAPSFFDEVCYTASFPAPDYRAVANHNLTVTPELIIIKARNLTDDWYVYHSALGVNKYIRLNSTAAEVSSSNVFAVSSTTFSTNNVPVASTYNYVAYLFATCAGVSKVGSYTGTGALQTVNCGFTSGARFVLIKRTDSTGDWYTYDSARGITSGNDPYLLLNSTAAEVTGTNYVDTDTTGFKVTAAAPAGLNASGGTYIFLAIA